MTVTKTFSKDAMREILWGDYDGYDVVLNEIYDTSRWSNHYTLVFKELATDKFYQTDYREGATEQQDERPFEYEDEVVCTEVAPVEVMKIEYQPVLAGREATKKPRAPHP